LRSEPGRAPGVWGVRLPVTAGWGFTLIELLIVVAIIAILAAIAVPNFLEAQTRAKVSRVKADMRALATAVEAYATDYNFYPLNGVLIVGGGIQNPQVNGIGAPAHKFLYEAVTTPVAYVSSLPQDPFVIFTATSDAWRILFVRYFYTNFDWFTRVTEPSSPPVIAQKKTIYGTWVLAGAGPDGDRLDLAADIHYDPTNGTVSNGDIIRSPRHTGN
jgi:prepilin-type N-terminal cleavage/methylation domain-containing protein